MCAIGFVAERQTSVVYVQCVQLSEVKKKKKTAFQYIKPHFIKDLSGRLEVFGRLVCRSAYIISAAITVVDAQGATGVAPSVGVLEQPGASNNSSKHRTKASVGESCDTVLKQTVWTLLMLCVAVFHFMHHHRGALT